jgi:hypothetical protein
VPREQTPHRESHGDDLQLAELHAKIERQQRNREVIWNP